MTRINLVEPEQLTNKHLVAEYRELPRIFTAVQKLVNSGKYEIYLKIIPKRYVLGSGHITFFYNKLHWLLDRYKTIGGELSFNKKFNIDKTQHKLICEGALDLINEIENKIGYDVLENYKPSPEEIYLNMARICKRSKLDNVISELYD